MGPYARSRAVTPSTVPRAPGGARATGRQQRVHARADQLDHRVRGLRLHERDRFVRARGGFGDRDHQAGFEVEPGRPDDAHRRRGVDRPVRERLQHAAACLDRLARARLLERVRGRGRRGREVEELAGVGLGPAGPEQHRHAAHQLVAERDRDDQLDRVGDRGPQAVDARGAEALERVQLVRVAARPHDRHLERRQHDRDRMPDLLRRQLRHALEAVAGERRVHHALVNAAQPLDERRDAAVSRGYSTDRYRSSSHGLTWTL